MTFRRGQETFESDAELGLARAIARKSCAQSLAWARTLVAITRASKTALRKGNAGRDCSGVASATSPGGIEDEMFVEVLAYSLRLLEIRLSAAPPDESARLAALVKHECRRLVGQANWRRRNHCARLSAPGPNVTHSRFMQLYPTDDAASGAQSRLTREMFEQFCRCTGLGSEVLVGTGENLASLVFYIALHAVVSGRGLPSREQVLKLLRGAQECRKDLQNTIWQLLLSRPHATALLSDPPASRFVACGSAGLVHF